VSQLISQPEPRIEFQPGAGQIIFSAHGIRKAFPGVVALDDISIEIRMGKVHALMGENGAGKSTLMKIIAGVHTPDQGELRLRGKPIVLKSPRHALNHGIAMIHQELNLLPHMTVAENIWIGREPCNPLGLIRHGELNRQTGALLRELAIDIDPAIELGRLTIASRQMVEIAKAVSFNSDLLIMDEPTSAITEKEVDHLFRIIAELKARGTAIVYITHKMAEVFEIADDISVFRDGRHVATRAASEFDKHSLISAMVGRELTQVFPKEEVPLGAVALSLRDIGLKGVFHHVSFEVHYGEILGVAGLMGSGRTEVVESLFGISPPDQGQILVDGKPCHIRTPSHAIRAGMALLTEDRKDSGLFLKLSVGENMQISAMKQHTTLGFVRQSGINVLCEEKCGQLRIKTPGLEEVIENLSGGNQQKVLLARWLLNKPRVLILDEPTRGVDVGAKAEIHALITRLAREGVAIIMISSELPEIMGMSDRIVVMCQRTVMGILPRAQATQESIMTLASGEPLECCPT